MPALDTELSADLLVALRREASFARTSAARYEQVAEMARTHADLSSAWVCELNRTEELDRARELFALVQGPLAARTPEAAPAAGAVALPEGG